MEPLQQIWGVSVLVFCIWRCWFVTSSLFGDSVMLQCPRAFRLQSLQPSKHLCGISAPPSFSPDP